MTKVNWIPVEERLPEVSGDYLVFMKYADQILLKGIGYNCIVHYSAHYKSFNTFDNLDEQKAAELAFRRVTHWAELPEPPKGWRL